MEQGLTPVAEVLLDMLRADSRRDLYEGAGPGGKGSGQYWVTYSAGEQYVPLTWPEVKALAARGLIVERWQGCYTTPANLTARPNRGGVVGQKGTK